jgi:hypothetical protein
VVGIPPDDAATDQQSSPEGCALEQYAEAKRLPIEFLRSLGLSTIPYEGRPATRIPVLDFAGEQIAVCYRLAVEKREGSDNRFRWKSGTKVHLYGLNRLDAARKTGWLVIAEGFSDCHTLLLHDVPCIGTPGTGWREDRDAHHLDGIDDIYVVVEPDDGGKAMLAWIATSRIRSRVRLVRLDGAKDVSDLYLSHPESFRERLQEALEASVPWSDLEASESEGRRQNAWESCRDLAASARILDRFTSDLRRTGLVGEERNARILYLAITSRLLERQASVAVKGPSSGGKSFLVARARAFFPPDACYVLSGMSERALAYSEEPLAHRVIILYEAEGLRGDFANYILRSLLSEAMCATRPWRRLLRASAPG